MNGLRPLVATIALIVFLAWANFACAAFPVVTR